MNSPMPAWASFFSTLVYGAVAYYFQRASLGHNANASRTTLLRRCRYNNRKARSAARRLGVQLVYRERNGPPCKFCGQRTLLGRTLMCERSYVCRPACPECRGSGRSADEDDEGEWSVDSLRSHRQRDTCAACGGTGIDTRAEEKR